jgi:hypothetical protein
MKRLLFIVVICTNTMLFSVDNPTTVAPMPAVAQPLQQVVSAPSPVVVSPAPAPDMPPAIAAAPAPATPATPQPVTTAVTPTAPATPAVQQQNLSIVALLGLNLQNYYNNRFDKIIVMGTDPEKRTDTFRDNVIDDFKKLLQLFEKAKAQPVFATLLATRKFGDRAVDMLKLSVNILDVKTSFEKNISVDTQIDALSTILKNFMELFTKYKEFSIDLRAEKSLFMNTITDFINNTAKEASTETLRKFETFLSQAGLEAFKKIPGGAPEAGPFDNKDEDKFEKWLSKIADIIPVAEKKRALSLLETQQIKPQANLSFRNFRTRRLSASKSLRPSSTCMR